MKTVWFGQWKGLSANKVDILCGVDTSMSINAFYNKKENKRMFAEEVILIRIKIEAKLTNTALQKPVKFLSTYMAIKYKKKQFFRLFVI